MPVLSSAVTARNRLDEDIALGLSAAHWEWQQMTPYLDDSWARVGPRMTSLVTASQARTAERAPLEVAQMLDEQGLPFRTEGSVRPAALAGVASDGRALESLLYQSLVVTGGALNAGVSAHEAMALGWSWLEQAIATQIADANRVAAGAQAVLTPSATRQVRVVNPGACARCIALAGIETYATTAFERHPQCRCKNVPTNREIGTDVGTDPMDYFNSMSESAQDKTFTKSGAQAIRDGADFHQVVNSRRGMYSTAEGKFTTEGMTRRGYAHHVMGQNPNWREQVGNSSTRFKVAARRLMPEQIYKVAKDRDDAIRLLKAFGYF